MANSILTISQYFCFSVLVLQGQTAPTAETVSARIRSDSEKVHGLLDYFLGNGSTLSTECQLALQEITGPEEEKRQKSCFFGHIKKVLTLNPELEKQLSRTNGKDLSAMTTIICDHTEIFQECNKMELLERCFTFDTKAMVDINFRFACENRNLTANRLTFVKNLKNSTCVQSLIPDMVTCMTELWNKENQEVSSPSPPNPTCKKVQNMEMCSKSSKLLSCEDTEMFTTWIRYFSSAILKSSKCPSENPMDN